MSTSPAAPKNPYEQWTAEQRRKSLEVIQRRKARLTHRLHGLASRAQSPQTLPDQVQDQIREAKAIAAQAMARIDETNEALVRLGHTMQELSELSTRLNQLLPLLAAHLPPAQK